MVPVSSTTLPAMAEEGEGDAEEAAAPEAPSDEPRRIDMPEPEAVDLLDAAGTPILKRVAPVLLVIVVLLILRRVTREKKRQITP